MSNTTWKPLKNICMHSFGSGPLNSNGLKMTFASNGHQIRSQVTVPEHLCGWSKLVHGGILTTICDEVMGWCALELIRQFTLTKSMAISFKKPARIKTNLTAVAYIKERLNERNALMTGEIYDTEGELCASCEGEFVLFTPDQFARMNLIPKELLEEMRAMFAIT